MPNSMVQWAEWSGSTLWGRCGGDAQHSTAVKSIGSIISRGSIIVVLPLFFDFCKEWVELPLWGRWNCHLPHFLIFGGEVEVELHPCRFSSLFLIFAPARWLQVPQKSKNRFFLFLGVSGTPKIKECHLGLPPGHFFTCCEKILSLTFLLATPSSPSRTLEGLFELTRRPSRALDSPRALLPERKRKRGKDTGKSIETYLQELSSDQLQELTKLYQPDFDIFGYSPIDTPVPK